MGVYPAASVGHSVPGVLLRDPHLPAVYKCLESADSPVQENHEIKGLKL